MGNNVTTILRELDKVKKYTNDIQKTIKSEEDVDVDQLKKTLAKIAFIIMTCDNVGLMVEAAMKNKDIPVDYSVIVNLAKDL